jgi:phage terminase large subunit
MWRRLVAAVLLVLAMSDALIAAAGNIRRWREQPEAFVFENFGVTPDAWQLRRAAGVCRSEQAAHLDAGVRRTGQDRGHGVVRVDLPELLRRQGRASAGVAFAITRDNLRDNLWPRWRSGRQRSAYLDAAFTWQAERIFAKHHPETWFSPRARGRRPRAPSSRRRRSPGCTAKYVLAFADESGAIPVPVLRGGEQMLSTGPRFGKFLQAGNPTSLEGMLYAAATMLRHQWHVIRITGDPTTRRVGAQSRASAIRRSDLICPKCGRSEQIADVRPRQPVGHVVDARAVPAVVDQCAARASRTSKPR